RAFSTGRYGNGLWLRKSAALNPSSWRFLSVMISLIGTTRVRFGFSVTRPPQAISRGAANQTVQPTGASRLAKREIERHRRLAPVADLCVRHEQGYYVSPNRRCPVRFLGGMRIVFVC